MPNGSGELRGRRILVVEDSFLVADRICDVLSECGCEVVGRAPNLERGWRLLQQESLDGALLDVNLGGELSFPIAVTLAERGIPFLFLTGYDDISIMPKEFRTVHHIRKPFDFNDLVAVIAIKFGGCPAHRSVPLVHLRPPLMCPSWDPGVAGAGEAGAHIATLAGHSGRIANLLALLVRTGEPPMVRINPAESRVVLHQQLWMILRDIAGSVGRIAKQHDVIAKLDAGGQDTTDALTKLASFKREHAVNIGRHRQIMRKLGVRPDPGHNGYTRLRQP